MQRLNNYELDNIIGGAVSWVGIGIGVSALVIFLSGVLEGYTNPGRCNV